MSDSRIPPGKEGAFTIHRRHHKVATLTIELPDHQSLVALKRALGEFADTSIIKLREFASPLKLGPLPIKEATEKHARLEKEGLRAILNAFTETGYILMERRGDAPWNNTSNPSSEWAWLIENEAENKRVIEDAIRRGVRIVETED